MGVVVKLECWNDEKHRFPWNRNNFVAYHDLLSNSSGMQRKLCSQKHTTFFSVTTVVSELWPKKKMIFSLKRNAFILLQTIKDIL